MHRHFDQIAYVTNDMAKAMEVLSYRYGVGDFNVSRLVVPAHIGHVSANVDLSVAKVVVAGLFIEIIQAHSDIEGFFTAALPKNGEFGLCFHHTGIVVDGDYSEWQKHFDYFDSLGRIFFTVDLGEIGEDVQFFFADERTSLGHYVEHTWLRAPAEQINKRIGARVSGTI